MCPDCRSSEVALTLADGTPIHGRLYVPPKVDALNRSPGRYPDSRAGGAAAVIKSNARLGAVIVCPGYLANLAFLEIPWAADLTRLGLAVLFLDRRGQGQSGGTFWPQPQPERDVHRLEPDIAAGLTYLRSLEPLVDPARIALLGHSHGATAAITAASADWDVRATVAISPSIALWQFVNHVVPHNLMLVYGADDHFVLDGTDQIVIERATRGYLAGPGRFGDIAEGSARKFLRVPQRGHLDVLYSDDARREILEWLRRALDADALVTLSPQRWGWVWTGVAAILLALSCTRPHTLAGRSDIDRRTVAPLGRCLQLAGEASARIFALIIVWALGLWLSPWLSRQSRTLVPAQEGSVLVGQLLGTATTLALGAGLLALTATGPMRCRRSGSINNLLARDTIYAFLVAAASFGAFRVLLMHRYEFELGLARFTLLTIFSAAAFPTFAALELWLGWVSGKEQRFIPGCLILIAAVTAGLSGQLFQRMSVTPGYLLSAALVIVAAHRMSNRTTPSISLALLGAVSVGWMAAVGVALN